MRKPLHRLTGSLVLALALPAAAWDSRTLATPVVIDDHTIPYPEFAIYVMPEQTFRVSFTDSGVAGRATFLETVVPLSKATLRAPERPGLYPLEVENAATGETARINVFTLVPASRVDGRGYLDDYRIGRYPGQPLRGMPIYRPPPGFVEVTEHSADTPVSPNFRLRQFVSKQTGSHPRYLILRPELLLKLESILAALNRSGRVTRGLVIMSGFRTPWYNQAIGNVQYSRHVWGGAADVYIDEAPADGRMDDLNGDGRVDREDARWLAEFVDDMSSRGVFGSRIGGLGIYGSNAAHGPFIHVDVRGKKARW